MITRPNRGNLIQQNCNLKSYVVTRITSLAGFTKKYIPFWSVHSAVKQQWVYYLAPLGPRDLCSGRRGRPLLACQKLGGTGRCRDEGLLLEELAQNLNHHPLTKICCAVSAWIASYFCWKQKRGKPRETTSNRGRIRIEVEASLRLE